MVGPDQFRPTFHHPARDELIEGKNPPADAVAGFQDAHVRSGLLQLVSTAQPSEPRSDHEHTRSRGPAGRRTSSEHERGSRGQRCLEKLTAGRAIGNSSNLAGNG